MKKKLETNSLAGVLSRLCKDQAGNTIAIMAAAVIPVIGLVGGSVDMSRIYLTQTRLQAACDAGALMGRKVMAGGAWADNSGRANAQALSAFNANFESGAYGTENIQRSFTELGGKVSGTASVDIPMTLMKVLGQEERTIRVSCSAEMRIPNSDVMFVLDTTGSMDDPVNSSQSVSATNPVKITELRKAVKCFYETLTQKNITDVTASQCGETADPVESASNTSQIRFGFVPYSINVNVGRLLPLEYMANTWFYQTRRANTTVDPDNTYTLGTPGTLTQVGSPSTDPTVGSWQNAANNVTISGTTYLKTVSVSKAPLDCNAISWPPTQNTGPTVNGPYETSTDTPAYPATTTTSYYEKTETSGSTEYRYIPENSQVSKNRRCFLQRKVSSSVTTTEYTASRPVTWIPKTIFNNWTYDRIEVDVSGLKNTGTNSYNSSITLPIGASGANATINWDGCILERQTQKNVTTWDTSATSAQKDMAIDLIPTSSDPTTLWGPRLKDVLYSRSDSNGWTLNPVTTTSNFSRPTSGTTTTACPSPSKLLEVWDPGVFQTYINNLTTDGYTFHDIGMLWGARLMSPTGIFAEHNAVANDNVQRHMIFMTDGDTNANPDALSAYNVPWFDRLQTDNAPSTSTLNTLTDDRTAALCTAVKNMNITLWVVSYGSDVASSTNARLQACASPGKFFQYQPGVSLTTQFKQIAGQIAALRLTT
ncbi:Tad domain-containing protein [uncultured Sphingorhabdus sp.]|uniref:Tad domain-containing protein n=1 Tax=uncultured Sphingorhabdus sp. TaxID=1686106 RepID=UPI00262460FB|nr:TadE/TadG family type IV pilus assembly protein [uncultured Sphingorhabdus sp.]HMS20440.1 Tad domain-containing protein [Sphingorhabdus sp.]